MPVPPRPSPADVTLAVDVPDYHSLAARFHDAGIPQLTCPEAERLASLRVIVPTDAAPRAVEVAVQFATSGVLRGARLVFAKAIDATTGDVFLLDTRTKLPIKVGTFAPVKQAAEVAA